MDTKLIYPVNLPMYLIDRFNISENTLLIARFEEGQILIETLTDSEIEDYEHTDFEKELDDSYDEGFLDGTFEGFGDGYEQGYHDAMHGNKYDPDYTRFDEDHRGEDCRQCCCGATDINHETEQKSMSEETTLCDFLDRLSLAEKRAALVYLSVKYAECLRGTEDAD